MAPRKARGVGCGTSFETKEPELAKDALDAMSDVVPRSLVEGGQRAKAARGRRSDRPLGRRGIDMLAQVPLFAGLSRKHLRKIAEHSDLTWFHQREPIVQVGQPSGTFYVILEGEARVVRGAQDGRPGHARRLLRRDSLLDGGPRTASVIAETPVTAIRIFKRSFDRVVAEEPAVASKILQVVARRLREQERSIND